MHLCWWSTPGRMGRGGHAWAAAVQPPCLSSVRSWWPLCVTTRTLSETRFFHRIALYCTGSRADATSTRPCRPRKPCAPPPCLRSSAGEGACRLRQHARGIRSAGQASQGRMQVHACTFRFQLATAVYEGSMRPSRMHLQDFQAMCDG